METILPLSSAKGLVFTCNGPTEILPYFTGDPLRLGRVLLNLFSNAVKYTEAGSITADITCRMDTKDTAIIECSIADTGIGIPEDKQDLIFEKFAQADSSITRRYGGTGLGLAITREIVLKMGGEIGFESEEGSGSRFWFRIPLVTAEIRPVIDKNLFAGEHVKRLPDLQRKKIADISILVAEDHLLNLAYIEKLLPRMGVKSYDLVANGSAAITALGKKDYDIILMDCHMPVMSGYDATRMIRETENNKGGHTPIIAMTADAMMGTRERCLASGMDDYISKPINPDELRHILTQWVTFDVELKAEPKLANPDSHPAIADLTNLKEFLDSEDELHEFINIFLNQSENILETLRNNVSGGHESLWNDAAHKLKGGAGMLMAERLRLLCEQAESIETAADREKMYASILHSFLDLKNFLSIHNPVGI